MTQKENISLPDVVIRFAGDSGDGMQLTGDRFTSESALLGNDISTLPNFPAEIRAPAGTLAGVSSFQVHIADHVINTPGDECDILIAMNPAALAVHFKDVRQGGTIIVDTGAFTKRNIVKAGWDEDPLENDTLDGYQVLNIDLTGMTTGALEDFDLGRKDKERSKNMFALGLVCWMYNRPTESTLDFISTKFAKIPLVRDANITAFNAGYAFGETIEAIGHRYEIAPAQLESGLYRQANGNGSLADGLTVGAHLAGLELVLGAYPITPASDVLHHLAQRKAYGVVTLQAEDEIAAVGMAVGASFAGSLGVTISSGPGIALKSETISLAVMTELPLVVVDVQRAGPSTGMPTKTEQADLLNSMYGRHGEAPVAILAAKSPTDCFYMAIEAVRIAIEYRTPVILLSDGYLANGAEPWSIPDIAKLPKIDPDFLTDFNAVDENGEPILIPYARDEKLARPWIKPGTKGLAHRIGGLEKDETGSISYAPDNHQKMISLRQAKIDGIKVPDLEVDDPDGDSDVLVVGWGSTWGPCSTAIERVRKHGGKIAHAHLQYLNPFPKNLDEILSKYKQIIVPEMNSGQLAFLLQARTKRHIESFQRVRGLPISVSDFSEYLAPFCDIELPNTEEKK